LQERLSMMDSLLLQDEALIESLRQGLLSRDRVINSYAEKDNLNAMMIDNLRRQVAILEKENSRCCSGFRLTKWVTIGAIGVTTILLLR
jgi:hypothetical protein